MPSPQVKLWLAALSTCALLAFGVLAAFQRGFLRFNYPSASEFPVRGLDVSHHQGVIDWATVARQGYAFVYLKATEGGDHVDRQFAANWAGARAAGLAVGAYHFFTFCRDGATQAQNFLSVVPADADVLPPVVDLEYGGNCAKTPTHDELKAELAAFLAAVETKTGRRVVYYVTPEFYREFFANHAPDRELWYRDVFARPETGTPYLIWQFGNRGRVDGIEGPVDLNVFAGDVSAFAVLRRR